VNTQKQTLLFIYHTLLIQHSALTADFQPAKTSREKHQAQPPAFIGSFQRR